MIIISELPYLDPPGSLTNIMLSLHLCNPQHYTNYYLLFSSFCCENSEAVIRLQRLATNIE